MSKIYETLRQAIETSPKSRYCLSKETGVEQSQISRFMAGKRGLGVESIEKLAQALGYEITIQKSKKRKKV